MNSDNIIINLSPSVSISLSPNALRGILLLGVSFYFRRLARDNSSTWSNLYRPVERSFENTTSPIDLVALGCGGLLSGILYWLVSMCALILGIDQFFANGDWFWVRHQEILHQIGEILGQVLQLFIMLLRQIAAEISG